MPYSVPADLKTPNCVTRCPRLRSMSATAEQSNLRTYDIWAQVWNPQRLCPPWQLGERKSSVQMIRRSWLPRFWSEWRQGQQRGQMQHQQ